MSARGQAHRDAAEQCARGTTTAAADDEQVEAAVSARVFECVGRCADEDGSFGMIGGDLSSDVVEVAPGIAARLRRSVRAVEVDDGREGQPANALAQQSDHRSCRGERLLGSVDSDQHADLSVFVRHRPDVGDRFALLASDRVDRERDDQGSEHSTQVGPREERVTASAHPDRDRDPDRAPRREAYEQPDRRRHNDSPSSVGCSPFSVVAAGSAG